MEGQDARRSATIARCPDSTAEQRLEVEAPVTWSSAGRRWQRRRTRGRAGSTANGKGETATVTWYGCSRECLRGVCKCVARKGSVLPPRSGLPGRGSGIRGPETRRTPGPAAGCNKPATSERRKPSRWCETTRTEQDFRGWFLGTEACGNACGSGRSVGEHPKRARAGRGRWRGGRRPNRAAAQAVVSERTAGRIPREEVEFDQGSSESSEEEPRPEGPHVSCTSAREARLRRGAAGKPRRPTR